MRAPSVRVLAVTRALVLWTLLACAVVAALPVLAYVRGDWRDWQRGRDLMRSQP